MSIERSAPAPTLLAVALVWLASGCGRIDYVVGGTGPVPPSDEFLVLHIDAGRADGTSPVTAGCPASSPALWFDLVSGNPGTLNGFPSPPCATLGAGWAGSGIPTDPYRLLYNSSQGVSFGTIAEATDFTIEVWARWAGGGRVQSTGSESVELVPLVIKGTAGVETDDLDVNYALGISLDDGNALATAFEESTTSIGYPLLGTAVTATAWHHLAVTYDGANRALYLDGALAAFEGQTRRPSLAVNSVLGVGASYEPNNTLSSGAFDGDIAAVKIYTQALSAAEIAFECAALEGRFEGQTCAD